MSYLDSKRIVGTNADRIGTDTISGGWKEVGRTTLGSSNDDITVSSLADKRYLMIMTDNIPTGSIWQSIRYNSDTGSNYANRYSNNGGSDVPSTSLGLSYWGDQLAGTNHGFGIGYTANLAGKEKLALSYGVNQNTSGAGTAPDRTEVVSKWTNTSDAINAVTNHDQGSGSFASGSEVVVLGYDPDDTHTTNFWEELASVNGTGATSFNSGTFTAKKYLWVQIYVDRSADASNGEITVGNTTLDTGSNYSRRRSADGGTDDTLTSQTKISLRTAGLKEFYNIFIINNSANEKLLIIHQNAGGTAGAGNTPYRGEFVAKWANTSNQINIIGFGSGGSNTLSSTSIMKVWGSN